MSATTEEDKQFSDSMLRWLDEGDRLHEDPRHAAFVGEVAARRPWKLWIGIAWVVALVVAGRFVVQRWTASEAESVVARPSLPAVGIGPSVAATPPAPAAAVALAAAPAPSAEVPGSSNLVAAASPSPPASAQPVVAEAAPTVARVEAVVSPTPSSLGGGAASAEPPRPVAAVPTDKPAADKPAVAVAVVPAPAPTPTASPAPAAAVVTASVTAAPAPAPVAAAVAQAPPTEDFESLLAKCREATSKGRWAAGHTACTAAQQARPDSPDVLTRLAEIALNRGQDRAALRLASSALAADPGFADAYVIVGSVEQGANRVPQARAAYTRYLKLAPAGRFASDLRAILATL